MQATNLTIEQAADVIAECEVLTKMEWGTSLALVLQQRGRSGRDILLIQNSDGSAWMIDECKHDADSGGSIHDHARAIFSANDEDGQPVAA